MDKKSKAFKWIDLVHLGKRMWGDLPMKEPPKRNGIMTKVLTDEEYDVLDLPKESEDPQSVRDTIPASRYRLSRVVGCKDNSIVRISFIYPEKKAQ